MTTRTARTKQPPPTDYPLIALDLIDVGERYRQDPQKDLDTLKDSINDVGLLNPISVGPPKADKHHDLLAGLRRVLAHRALGLTEIEAHIVHDLDEAGRLTVEHDENMCRVRMSTGEARKLKAARQKLLAPLAKENSRANLKQGDKSPSRSRSESGAKPKRKDTRDIAAKDTGRSAKTPERAQEIADIAADETQPEDIQKRAAELSALVDNDEASPAAALADVQTMIKSKNQDGEYRKQASALEVVVTGLRNAATTLENAFLGADNYDHDLTPELVSEHVKLIRAEAARINKAVKAATDIGAAKKE